MRISLALVMLLSGCTINVVDSRVTRAELAQAFEQRDNAIANLAKALEKLKKQDSK